MKTLKLTKTKTYIVGKVKAEFTIDELDEILVALNMQIVDYYDTIDKARFECNSKMVKHFEERIETCNKIVEELEKIC